MNIFDLGTYVIYKAITYIVVGAEVNSPMRHLLNPLKGQGKLHVHMRNITHAGHKAAVVVCWWHANYIVTGKDLIISCKTRRVMNWCDGDGNREAILDMANKIREHKESGIEGVDYHVSVPCASFAKEPRGDGLDVSPMRTRSREILAQWQQDHEEKIEMGLPS